MYVNYKTGDKLTKEEYVKMMTGKISKKKWSRNKESLLEVFDDYIDFIEYSLKDSGYILMEV
jgi:hypothetical protein